MAKRFVHIVYPAGQAPPLYAFARSDLMHTTARAMLGVEVVTLEVHEQLPGPIRDDLEVDFDEDDETPRIVVDVDETD